ncbi:hypothetical protein BpHYR1_015705 [Brachionus plicatilis]|uniref:Uncharacterized protein n=1 Tax=Brachionus plicatilis TaxID=10195 RepID=A0A3M7RFJ5_BRAPC|nr:hypothetical protein BpHYR1_015705 [Brachionus plicatilis]
MLDRACVESINLFSFKKQQLIFTNTYICAIFAFVQIFDLNDDGMFAWQIRYILELFVCYDCLLRQTNSNKKRIEYKGNRAKQY